MLLSRVFETLTYPQWLSIFLKKDLGADDENIGLINAVRSGIDLPLQLIGGVTGQRVSHKSLYLLYLLIQTFAFLIAFLAKDWSWAILMSIILGFQALTGPGISALRGNITDRDKRATIFAFEATLLSLVVMLRGPLQGYLAETTGLRQLYLLGIFGLMLSFFIFLMFFPEIKRDRQESEQQVKAVFSREWREKVRQVFVKMEYRRNFIGLIQAGVMWRLFLHSFDPFISIYLYEEIGWSFIFFGFYDFFLSLLRMVLKIPFGKIIDKYHLRRIAFFIGPITGGIMYILMVFIRNPYYLATIFLIQSIFVIAHNIATSALWYDAIPIEVYSIGSSIRGVIYGCSSVIGFLLGAYLWVNLGYTMVFCIVGIAQISRAFVALYFIRDIKDEKNRRALD